MTVTTARPTTGVKAEEGDLVVLRKERTISTHNNRKQRWNIIKYLHQLNKPKNTTFLEISL